MPNLTGLRAAAYFYWSNRAIEKARIALTQAAAMDPRDPSLVVDLALVADELGDQAGHGPSRRRLKAGQEISRDRSPGPRRHRHR